MRELKPTEAYDLFMLEAERLAVQARLQTNAKTEDWGQSITKLRRLNYLAKIFWPDFNPNEP